MEFSPTSSPYPAQSSVAVKARFGDEWEKTHLKWKTITYLPKQTDLQQQQAAILNMVPTHNILQIVKNEYFCIAFHENLVT